MPKLRGPLLSLGATGGLTKLFSLARRMGRNIIERKPIPVDAKSPAQLFNRHMFNKCIDLWHLLSEAEKTEWERLATPRHMTGYAWYISQCLRPNPGIYLPLQGGTMSGNIDMAKNRLLKLPAPTDDQEAATKGYADTHGMVAHEDTHTKGKADEIDSALAIKAMAGLASTKIWQGNAAGRPIEVDPPAGLTFTELVGGEAHEPSQSGVWEDWDISGIVPAGTKYVLVEIYGGSETYRQRGARKNGSALHRAIQVGKTTACLVTEVDANRVIECYFSMGVGMEFGILGYWS